MKRTKHSIYQIWKCKCECGGITLASSSEINTKKKTSCGCPRVKDITNKRFGKLIAKRKVMSSRRHTGNGSVWELVCDCGEITWASLGPLSQNITNSCGCLRKETLPYGKNRHIKVKQSKQQIKIGNKYNLTWDESAALIQNAQNSIIGEAP